MSTCDISKPLFLAGPHLVELGLQCSNLDIRGFQILRNMLWQLQQEGVEVRALRVTNAAVSGGSTRTLPVPDEDNSDDVYPAEAEPFSFGVDYGDPDETPSFSRRCLIEHRGAIDASDVANVQEVAQHWFELLECGGFSMPETTPPDCDSFGGPVLHYDEITVEISVMRYDSNENGWFCLFNILDQHNLRAGNIDRVVLD